MIPQRCTAASRLLGLLAAAFLFQLLAPLRASAVQIFVENAFVHRKNAFCLVQNVNGVPHFLCPPFPATVACAVVGPCTAGAGNLNPSVNPCEPGIDATGTCAALPGGSGYGNISNEPHIEFDTEQAALNCAGNFNAGGHGPGTPPFNPGVFYTNVCNASVFLCGAVGFGSTDTTANTAIDQVSFEVFQFQNGANALDPNSTPPLRTFFVDAPGFIPGGVNSDDPSVGPRGPFCVLFDGSVNLQGAFGKRNGQYGFRVNVQTNEVGASGNIQLTATRAYPSAATRNADFACAGDCGTNGHVVSQNPIIVDVTNVHAVASSPTVVGAITGVPAEPYNLFYRLSKDATMFITINNADATGLHSVRTILPGVARVGEGTPSGTLTNGDSWNGRADNGALMPPGNYLASFWAIAQDQFGVDLAQGTTMQIGIDPLQITDLRVQPLLPGATSLAVLLYTLTEPATTFIDIYPPGTQFCPVAGLQVLNNVNSSALDQADSPGPPKNFHPSLDNCATTIGPIKRIVEQKNARVTVQSFWDGRDQTGAFVPDGDYVFVLYAALPSQNGFPFTGNLGAPDLNDRRIWTTRATSGFVSVLRGLPQISQVSPASSVIGSSPPVSGLDPFLFRYSMGQDEIVNLRVFDATGKKLIKTIVQNEIRPGGNFPDVERWDQGTSDAGLVVDSGTYMVQLTATDQAFPAKVSTTTALFSVNLFRITDVLTTPILGGASDFVLVSYQLSQTMNMGLNIYPPGTVIVNSTGTWPPCLSVTPGPACAQVLTPAGTPASPVVTINGLRAGRLKITERWDGRDVNGLLVPDGSYIFTLTAQSTSTPTHFATDRVIGNVAVQRGQIIFPSFSVAPDVPVLFNTSQTVSGLDPFTIDFSLTRQSSVTIQILTTTIPPVVVRTLIAGQVRENGLLLTEIWDGRDDRGNFPPPGFYTVRAIATDLAAQLSSGSTAQVTIAFDPLRIYDVAVTPLRADNRQSSILYQVSESMKVAVKIFRPGTTFDAAGNPSPPESVSLVKRIVGVKQARTQIEDIWDGTDLRLGIVPDGTYRFKIVGSTDITAIDSITGNVLNPGALAEDRPIDDIPVVRNASVDPLNDFEHNTFAYPNPVNGPAATFSIFVPLQATVKLRLYTIAGEEVLEKDFGEQASSFQAGPLIFVWPKTNASGRAVARGIYYAVIRVEETLGGKNVFQSVKRLLLP